MEVSWYCSVTMMRKWRILVYLDGDDEDMVVKNDGMINEYAFLMRFSIFLMRFSIFK